MKTLPTLSIDRSRCVRCGRCVNDCLARIIALDGDGFPAMIFGGAARCFGCQHCLAVCPAGALTWFGKRPADSAPIGKIPTPEEMMNLIRQRRSVRNFRRENADRAVLEALDEAMAFVPTGCNSHKLFFSYSDDLATTDAMRQAVAESVLEFVKSRSLPKSIAHFANFRAALEGGADIFFRGAPHFVAISVARNAKDAHIDPFIAATTFELLANSFGLGTCWGGMATDLFLADRDLLARLNLPPEYDLKIIMLFGIPRAGYARVPQPARCGRTRIKPFERS